MYAQIFTMTETHSFTSAQEQMFSGEIPEVLPLPSDLQKAQGQRTREFDQFSFEGTSSFCWWSYSFGLVWGGPFARSLLLAVAGVPSPDNVPV